MSKLTYGAFGGIPYLKSDPEHRQRLGTTYTSVKGMTWIRDRFTVILPKVTPRIKAPALFSYVVIDCRIHRSQRLKNLDRYWTIPMERYYTEDMGDDKNPRWKDVDSGEFRLETVRPFT